MTNALIDDQYLGAILRGRRPRPLVGKDLYTTGHWYVRLCQAVLGANERTGMLSTPFADLPENLQQRALDAVMELPNDIGLISLRTLAPGIARLRQRHQLNILAIEAVAAAQALEAQVYLSAPSPLLETALRAENLSVTVSTGPK